MFTSSSTEDMQTAAPLLTDLEFAHFLCHDLYLVADILQEIPVLFISDSASVKACSQLNRTVMVPLLNAKHCGKT